jgi:hypothetical protein
MKGTLVSEESGCKASKSGFCETLRKRDKWGVLSAFQGPHWSDMF